MKTVLLAGGFGTRLAEESESKPKPMVEVGGRPILWHIMRGYAARGFNEFVIALGYRGDTIKRYFLDYHYLRNDLTIDLRTNDVAVRAVDCEDWVVHLRDTGLHTQTGGRLRRLADLLRGETFMMTYGDGVCSLDVRTLLAFHRRHGKLADNITLQSYDRLELAPMQKAELAGFFARAYERGPLAIEDWVKRR